MKDNKPFKEESAGASVQCQSRPAQKPGGRPWARPEQHNNSNNMTNKKTMIGYIEKTRKQVAVSALGKRSTRTSVGSARLASADTDWSWAANQLQTRCHRPLNHILKSRITLGLCVVLGTGFVSVQAADNPSQAACRAALEQKLKEPNAWEPQPLTETANLPSVARKETTDKPAAGIAGTASVKTTVPQKTAPVSVSRVTTPVSAAPAITASTAVAPDAVAPDAVASPTVASPAVASAMVAPTVKGHLSSFLLMIFVPHRLALHRDGPVAETAAIKTETPADGFPLLTVMRDRC